jgi:hypothetical protein
VPAAALRRRAPQGPEIDPFATGVPAAPGIPWRPATEIDVDVNNAPDFALADGLVPSGDPLALPPRVRWRQRAVGRCRASPAGASGLPGRPIAAGRAPAAHADPDSSLEAGTVATAAARVDDMAAVVDASGLQNPSPTIVAASIENALHQRDVGDFAEGIDGGDALDADERSERTGDAGDVEGPLASGPDADQAPRPTDAEPQLAPRDVELWLLARRAHGAALRLDFELRTALARQVFRRDFVYVSRQLHALEASRRVQGLDRARLNDALATLRQRAEAIQAFLEQRSAELQAAVDARCQGGARIAFARPARFQATIVSPGAHRFLSLLLLADEMLARLEMAWLLGLVEPAQRSTLISDCRRALLGFKDLACDLRHAVGVLVQEVNAQRREGP